LIQFELEQAVFYASPALVASFDHSDDGSDAISLAPVMSLAELLARTFVRLQQLAGCHVKFARVAETKAAGVFKSGCSIL